MDTYPGAHVESGSVRAVVVHAIPASHGIHASGESARIPGP